jgi:hypothetical protein
VYTLAWYVVTIGPYVLLAYAAAYVSTALSAALDSSDRVALRMPRFSHGQWLTHDLGPLGIWVAVAGFLAQGVRQPPPDVR